MVVEKSRTEEVTQIWQNSSRVINRGDPSAFDWVLTNLTTDGAYHDLDCSSKVPAGARFIIFRVRIKDNLVSQQFTMRKNGDSNTYNIDVFYTMVANVFNRATLIVACDKDRKVEYAATSTTWTNIDISISGWVI